MKEISIATFNVRGITKDEKKTNLAVDLNRYKIDMKILKDID